MRIIYRVNEYFTDYKAKKVNKFISNRVMIYDYEFVLMTKKGRHFLLDGQLHREGGPASYLISAFIPKKRKYYYLHGELIREDNYWERIKCGRFTGYIPST